MIQIRKGRIPQGKRILITSALPYVNNVPHLGNIVGCVLSADVFARYCRLRRYETLYICGTDEYGTATEIKAREEGLIPEEICSKYRKIHADVYEWFGISFDYFGRTSTPEHTKIVQEIFLKLYENGFIKEEEVEQLYDEEAEMFLADRYVEGTCPHCGYEGARGDQCDGCGKVLTPGELIGPVSKITKSTPVEKRTKHLFLDLPKIEPELRNWIETASDEGAWSENAMGIVKGWLEEGLRKRSITRDLKWGVPVPLEGYEGKVFYVWFDAPIGYLSITANYTNEWENWWKAPEKVALYQFMGKDNVPFHTVVFPSTLLGTRQDWTMLYHISTTEFLNYEGGKFSKSRNVGVFGNGAVESGVPADVWRYYLLRNRPEHADTNFSWEDFREKTNNELIANIGNLINRTMVFIKNNFGGELPYGELSREDEEFLEKQKQVIEKYGSLLDEAKIKEGLEKVLEFSKNANRYFQENKPWELVKSDKERAGVVLYVLANQAKDLGLLCSPYLPQTSDVIFSQLGISPPHWESAGKTDLEAGAKLGEVKILFQKMEKETAEKLREKYSGKTEESSFSSLDLEAGKIISVEKHPDADKLYIERVEMGNGEERQIVSGLAPYLEKGKLEGTGVIIVKNLAPAKLRGVESRGMLLAAEGKEGLEVIDPGVEPGEKILAEGVESIPKKEIKFKNFSKVRFEVEGHRVFADGKKLVAGGKEIKTKKVSSGRVS
ncbi:MAG: methionine--tRNA ligase [Candidatus Micrarchaeia archaeon]